MPQQNKSLDSYYDQAFYDQQVAGSLVSAKKYVAILSKVLSPKSVLDVGCGRGAWLKAFLEQGADRLVGIDGPWNSQTNMIDDAIEFVQCDLENISALDERFDLSLSLEVGEHLSINASERLVSVLCTASDIVVFGAAIPGQGGTNHINEQLQSFWANKFVERGYSAFDLFRPKVWGDADVEVWYRQNTFLYVKKGAFLPKCEGLLEFCEISSPAFMNLRHPGGTGIKEHFADLRNAVRKRLAGPKQ